MANNYDGFEDGSEPSRNGYVDAERVRTEYEMPLGMEPSEGEPLYPDAVQTNWSWKQCMEPSEDEPVDVDTVQADLNKVLRPSEIIASDGGSEESGLW